MCESLLLEPFTIQREWAVEDIPVLTAEIVLPRPADRRQRPARRLERYYQMYARSYLHYCEHWLYPQAAEAFRQALAAGKPLPCDRAGLRYQVACNTGGVLSLYVDSREVCSGRTERHRRGDTWDLLGGYPILLADCFRRKAPWRKILLSRAEAEIQRQEAAGISCYHEGWRHLLRRNFNPDNFYLSTEGVTFFYQMYAIAPAAEGIPIFFQPFGENDCLFPVGSGRIHIKEQPEGQPSEDLHP